MCQLTEDGPKMPLEGLQDCGLDFLDGLAQELLGRSLQKLVSLHDLTLGDAGHGEGHALGRLDALAHRVQRHHLHTSVPVTIIVKCSII